MDYEQTIIPGHIYQSWLQSASDIVSRRGRKRKVACNMQHSFFCSILYATWIIFEIDYAKQHLHAFQRFNAMSTMKIGNLMDLPPTVLLSELFTTGNREVHYPAPLLELWVRSTQPPHDSPSRKNSISVSSEEVLFL